MSRIHLSPNEARIIGCLLEKAVLTPDQCPLTLNALTAACNQKTSREPVLALDRTTVERTARDLREKSLVMRDENFRSGVVKYQQRLCNTMFSELNFSEAEYAVVCLLLLRGPQTPGELRARSGRLHVFADNEAVEETLQQLMDTGREGGAVVARLARVPGRRDHQYAHLLSGAIESVPADDLPARTQSRGGSSRSSNAGSPRWSSKWRRSRAGHWIPPSLGGAALLTTHGLARTERDHHDDLSSRSKRTPGLNPVGYARVAGIRAAPVRADTSVDNLDTRR